MNSALKIPFDAASDVLYEVCDTMRALYEARCVAIGADSLAGLAEAVRREAAGDLHPAVRWPIYAATSPEARARPGRPQSSARRR